MRIEYNLKFIDYLLFSITHQFLSVTTQALFLGASIFFAYLAIGYASLVTCVVIGLLAYAAMWVFQLIFSVIYLFFGKNRSLLTKHQIEIQPDALYTETSFNRTYHYWRGIVRVVKRFGFIAVYINGQAAHIIPNRAFSSNEQREAFLSGLKTKLV
jgi:YcxB-like protein